MSCLAEGSGTLHTAKCVVAAGATFWQRSSSAQQVTHGVSDDSRGTAGAQRVAHLVPVTHRVLESVMRDSSVTGRTYVCVCAVLACLGII